MKDDNKKIVSPRKKDLFPSLRISNGSERKGSCCIIEMTSKTFESIHRDRDEMYVVSDVPDDGGERIIVRLNDRSRNQSAACLLTTGRVSDVS